MKEVKTKSSIKTIGVYILLTIAAFCIGYFSRQQRPEEVAKVSPSKSVQVLAEAKIISQKVDAKGIQHTIIEETDNIIPFSDIMRANDHNNILDSTARELDLKTKQIESLLRINSQVTAKNLQATKLIDSLNRTTFNYKSKNLSLTYIPANDTMLPGTFDYAYNSELNVVQYSKKANFLAQRKRYIDISTDDKNATINNVKRLVIEQDQPKVIVKLQTQAIYTPEIGNLLVGPNVSVDLKKLNFGAGYLYNTRTGKYNPMVTANYTLLTF